MDILSGIFNFVRDVNSFYTGVLIVFLIFYNLYALVLTFQIFTFNRLMTQNGFANIFKFVALIHAGASFVLLLISVLAL